MTDSASALIDHLSEAQEIGLATALRSGGEVTTPIWAVVVDGNGYIRNGFGASSRWYRRAQRTHRATVVDGDRRLPVRIEDVDDEPTLAAVDRAYRRKYRGEGVSAVTSAGSRRYTMRIVVDDEPVA